jgi:ribosome-interacting GTPase 1
MPINPSPEYKEAEAAFRKARDPADRLRCLKEMLRTIPKHKGTERLQADLKTKIKSLTDELAGPRKGGARTGPAQAVRPEGAAQVALVGPPNSGKSSLHARLTGAHTEIAPYPFTTKAPVPGMLPYQDVHLQLVDLPAVSADFIEPWYANALQTADAAMLVVDLSDPECVEHVPAIRRQLDERRVTLTERWPGEAAPGAEHGGLGPGGQAAATAPGAVAPGASSGDEELPDPFRIHLPTLLVANKSDLDPDPDEVDVLEELTGVRYPALSVSAETGAGLAEIAPMLFRGLAIVRVYTKAPGREPDRDRPYTLRRGATVQDVARLVHRDLAEAMKLARVWGSGAFEGQQVGPEHRVADGDVVELH